MVFVAQSASQGEDIWVAGSALSSPRRLTMLNPALDKVVLGKSEVISWRSARGDTLRGALLLPAGYQQGKRYPLVVKLYAGSMLSDRAFHFGNCCRNIVHRQRRDKGRKLIRI